MFALIFSVALHKHRQIAADVYEDYDVRNDVSDGKNGSDHVHSERKLFLSDLVNIGNSVLSLKSKNKTDNTENHAEATAAEYNVQNGKNHKSGADGALLLNGAAI
jgi:hypothetical protein